MNPFSSTGETALTHASNNGRTEVVALLLTRPDIRVNLADFTGETPLVKAAREGNLDIVNMLLQR